MVCLGFEPGVAGWKVQMNPLSFSGTPNINSIFYSLPIIICGHLPTLTLEHLSRKASYTKVLT